MGINTHVYSYWGVRTEWNDAVHDRYEELEESYSSNVEILMDGMSGDELGR